MIKMKKILSILLLIVMTATALTGCNGAQKQSFQAKEDFEKANIGIMLGSSFDVLAKEYLPEAERCYYGTLTDLASRLETAKGGRRFVG